MITNAVSRPPPLHHHRRVTARHAATSDFAGALVKHRGHSSGGVRNSHLPNALLNGDVEPSRSPIVPARQGIRVSRPTPQHEFRWWIQADTSVAVCRTTRYAAFDGGLAPVAGSIQKDDRTPFQVPRTLRGTPGSRCTIGKRHNQRSHSVRTRVATRTEAEKN